MPKAIRVGAIRVGRSGCRRFVEEEAVRAGAATNAAANAGPDAGCGCRGAAWDLKFRDSLTEMDSRFRGNDVISARRFAFRLAVIPAKAGIHRLIQAF